MDDTDIAIVLYLLEHPDASNKELAMKIDVSQATVSRRLKRLFDQRILFEKSLLPNYSKLGLRKYSIIIIPAEPFSKNIALFHLFFQFHCYTAYQNKIFGKQNGLFIQLSLPDYSHVSDLVNEFLAKLQFDGYIQEYRLFIPRFDPRTYKIDTTKYNIETREFSIDYQEMRKIMRNNNDTPLSQVLTSDFDKTLLNETNIKLIRELYLDATRSLAKIGEKIGDLSKQEISRRMKAMGTAEWEYVMPYDRQQFGVFNQTLFVLNDNGSAMASLDKILKIFPFPATLYPSTGTYFLWINLPAVDVTKFTDILKERFSIVDLYLLDRRPISYPPWEANLENNKWKISMEKLDHSYTPKGSFISIQQFFLHFHDVGIDELIEIYQDSNSNN